MKDKISVIIPCYNAQNYIGRCLRSIEKQSYGMDRLEVILIDDASSDDTYARLLEFEKKYPENVLVISCGENSGPANARNIGLKYASGEYITFVDADDMIADVMLALMSDAAGNYVADIVECAYQSFAEGKPPSVRRFRENYFLSIETPEERGRFVLASLKTAVWGRLYRKSFIEENGLYFPENMSYGEDNFFSGLAMLACKSYYYIGDTLYYYFENTDGLIRGSGGEERVMQLAVIMELYINELDARGFLDGGLSGFGGEFEWYMIYKYFMDPVSFTASRKMSQWHELALYFGRNLLKYFPEAGRNKYLNSDARWRDYVSLLKEAANGNSKQ